MQPKYGFFASKTGTTDQMVAPWPAPQPTKAPRSRIAAGMIGGLLMIALLISGCSGSEPAVDNLAASTPTNTAAPTNTATPAHTPTATAIPDEIVDEAGHVMRLVPAGEFTMGPSGVDWVVEHCNTAYNGRDPSARCSPNYISPPPEHTVYLDAYFMDVYEVTVAQYAEFLNAMGNQGVSDGYYWDTATSSMQVGYVPWLEVVSNGSEAADQYYAENYYHMMETDGVFSAVEGQENYPANSMTWYGAQAYCEWRGATLPTDAQWEKAARGADGLPYPWGDEFDGTKLNYFDKSGWGTNSSGEFYASISPDDGYAFAAPVGSYPEGISPYGMYDMLGNVSEWVADWYLQEYYFSPAALEPNPTGPDGPWEDYPIKITRGTSFGQTGETAYSANSSFAVPGGPSWELGFRCALPIVQP